MSKTKQKNKLKRQFMGKVNSVGFESRKRRGLRLEVYAQVEIRLDRVMTVEEAQDKVEDLRKTLVGQDVVLFAP